MSTACSSPSGIVPDANTTMEKMLATVERLRLKEGYTVAARREARIRDITQLKALGVTTGWAAPYVLLDGRRAAVQLRMW